MQSLQNLCSACHFINARLEADAETGAADVGIPVVKTVESIDD